jgi:hypothetical protein
MADSLVNPASAAQLAQRNSEPTHLAGNAATDIGGTGVNSPMNSAKINAAAGVSTDTSVKGAGQLSEPSHLKSASASDDIDVKFDDDDDVMESDDIDSGLDKIDEDTIEIESGDDDEDDDKDKDKKDVKEDTSVEVEDPEQRGDNEGAMEASLNEPEAAMNSGPNKVGPGNGVQESKKTGRKSLSEDEEIVIKKDDDDKDKDKKDDGDKKPNPFAKKDDDKDGDKKPNPFVKESLKLRIKLPQTSLFESVGFSSKQQKQVGVIFETALKDITKQVSSQVSSHYQRLHEQKIAQRDAVIAKQVDEYLNYVVEEWVKSNKVSIRQSLRTQLAEEFLTGLQRLFVEHYIDVPESKVDVVKKLTEQVETLKTSLNEQHTKTMKVRKLAEAANKARIVEQFIRKTQMSEASAAKFMKLAEGVNYSTAKDFREKLGLLKESYFGAAGDKSKTLTEQRLPAEQVVVEETASKASSGDPDVDYIASELSRQVKSQNW